MRILALALMLLLAGCVLWPDETWSDAPRAPKPGDLVRVETRDRVKHVFRVYKTEEHAFYGVARDGLKYKVPYGALRSLEVRDREYAWIAVPVAVDAVATAIMGPILVGH
jgi:hypothetical protein